jgi:hypothetical protein
MTGTSAARFHDEPIITCRKVNKWFGDFHVLKDITVDIFPVPLSPIAKMLKPVLSMLRPKSSDLKAFS